MYFEIIISMLLLFLIVLRFFYTISFISNVLPIFVFAVISLILFTENFDSSTVFCTLVLMFTGIYRMRFHWEDSLDHDDDIWNRPLLIFITSLLLGALFLLVSDNYEQFVKIQVVQINELPIISVLIVTFLHLVIHRGER
jgi:hypothetical protein